jgi:hypothetical protein
MTSAIVLSTMRALTALNARGLADGKRCFAGVAEYGARSRLNERPSARTAFIIDDE